MPTTPETEPPFFLASNVSVAGRSAVVSEDGDSLWLYLTDVDGTKPVRDCWLHNTPSSDPGRDMSDYEAQQLPPPVPEDLHLEGAIRPPAPEEEWSFIWSPDGHAVAVAVSGAPLGVVAFEHECGFSRYLGEASAWGVPWNEDELRTLFPWLNL